MVFEAEREKNLVSNILNVFSVYSYEKLNTTSNNSNTMDFFFIIENIV